MHKNKCCKKDAENYCMVTALIYLRYVPKLTFILYVVIQLHTVTFEKW